MARPVDREQGTTTSLVIDVPAALDRQLREQAELRGLAVVDFVRSALEALVLGIERDPQRRNGAPTLVGTRTAVHDIVASAKRYHGDLARVHTDEFPDLSIEKLRAVLEWY
jgi:uncharacterized protein (DUF433 family)